MKTQRPTCPECGSLDLDIHKRWGKCKSCGKLRPASHFRYKTPAPFPADGRPRDGLGYNHILPTTKD